MLLTILVDSCSRGEGGLEGGRGKGGSGWKISCPT